ncbi:hypothetical protein LUZ60_006954 [Juncus effusus]|nr:hypothetical protein LUZ60_006954 [Juncus effusus]
MASSLLRSRSHLLLPHLLPHLRSMGGGPRTFPGGLNKWQYKRMHEKLAKDKTHRLIQTEKELYLSRVRSEIRSSNLKSEEGKSECNRNFEPMSSEEQVKKLADRFTKPGAEDLWNEDDGPVREREGKKKVLEGSRRMEAKLGPGFFVQKREFSIMRKWKGNPSSEDESESESEFKRNDNNKRFSSAALREIDVKREKRTQRPFERRGLSREIQEIKDEFRYRKENLGGEERMVEVKEELLLSKKSFDEFGISDLTVKALTDSGYIQTTVVQEAALPVCLYGKDVLVKARTGAGKSVAFLLPAIEAVLKQQERETNMRVPPITTLILCPTRELAVQLTAEIKVLLKYHEGNGIGVQSLYGGTRFKLDQKRLESSPCQILVATPGRLLDHIENKTGFSVRLMGLKMLILDETDHLLDLGFKNDIEKIVDCLPRNRQSIVFTATLPKEIRRISQLVLKRDHEFVDTVGLASAQNSSKVMQSYYILPHEMHFHMVYRLLKEHIMQEPDYKVIVYCTTAMLTSFLHITLRDLRVNCREIHSRKPQLFRARIAQEFKESNRIVLVTCEGNEEFRVNYPDVTLVIQVGIPSDREQYIRRLGRTNHEGKNGKGILLLAPFEEYFIDEIKDLGLEKSQAPQLDSDLKQKVSESISKVDTSIKESAYHAWLGYYNSISQIGRDKTSLAELANRFCFSIGLQNPPALFRNTALKMGLKDIPGIRTRK